jgi:hypothetical protein
MTMQGLALIVIYLVVAFVGQALGLGLSWVIEQYVPAIGLPIFLTIFFAMLLGAWPISVRLTNWLSPDPAPVDAALMPPVVKS